MKLTLKHAKEMMEKNGGSLDLRGTNIVITGACRQGTARFVESLGELKETYTIREAIEITKGQYNSEAFKRFFGN